MARGPSLSMLLRLSALIALNLSLLPSFSESLAVISIDFGSESLKVALVKPGVPMEIVLNKESKRKTPSIVSMRNEERLFGDGAYGVSIKYPRNAYPYLQFIAGQQYDSEAVTTYRRWFPHHDLIEDTDTGTVLFKQNDVTFSPEELLGMIFNSSRQFAEEYAEQPVKDVVITVPPFYSMSQRKAVLRAADLVGLTVRQLINDNTAVALNYGVFRRQEFNVTPQYFMFYDMGALSTVATIAEYKLIQSNESGFAENVPQLTIKGVGYDRTLGGLGIDMKLQQFLAEKFQALGKAEGSIYESPRAMAKLLKEAKRLKQVLSANTDHYAQIEGLLEDIDFKAKVTRDDLESLCANLFDRVSQPVTQALKSADMTMDEVDQVILFGGGTRVPKVQEILMETCKKSELGKNINTDEAAALGAVYQGAVLTKAFRVKKFIVKDAATYPIEVNFQRNFVDEETGEQQSKAVRKTLFQRNNQYPQKKLMTFNRIYEDFSFNITYGTVDYLSEQEKQFLGSLVLNRVSLEGVANIFNKHKDKTHKGIKAHFRMDDSGILHVDNVEVLFEHEVEELVDVPPEVEQSTFSKISSKISSFFGGGSSSEEDTKSVDPVTETDDHPVTDDVSSGPADDDKEKEEDTPTTSVPSATEEMTPPTPTETPSTTDEVTKESAGASPDVTDASPDATEESPDTTDASPDATEESPDATDGSPDANEGLPDTTEGSPDATDSPQSELPSDEPEPVKPDQTSTTGEHSQDTGEASKDGQELNATDTAEQSLNKKLTTKLVVVKEPLIVDVTVMDVTPPSVPTIVESKTKLELLYDRDEEKRLNALAKNSLESHIFEMQALMYSDGVVTFSTEEERTALLTALSEASDWLYDEGDNAETRLYKQKLRELKKMSKPVFKRSSEAQIRPKVVADLKEILNLSSYFLAQMKNFSNSSDMESIFTEVEITTLQSLTSDTQEWFTDIEGRQNATKPWEEPVMLVEDVQQKVKALDRETRYMINKLMNYAKRPKTPPPSLHTNTTTASNDTSSNTTGAEDLDDAPSGGYEEGPTSTYDNAPSPPPTGDDNNLPPPPTGESGTDSTTDTGKTTDSSNEASDESSTEEVLQLDDASEEKTDEHNEL